MSDTAQATLAVGAVFNNRYRVVRIIKSGGMGSVYEVLDETTNSPRALKVMLPSVVEDADQRARFALEAKITGNIESDHLLRVFDAGIRDTTGEPFIVMDLLRGEELQAMLTKRGPLPPEEVLVYLTQLALVLEKTHAAGIVHRDLKPENLFVTRRDDGSPCIKVLDFGIAKVVAQQQAQKTRALGTPLYMAPEQIRGESTIGPRADLYSFAQVGYTLLTGEPYWTEEAKGHDSLYPLLMALLTGAKEAPSARAQRRTGARLPPGFDAWFGRAASPQPEARYESATAQVNALAAVLRGHAAPGGYASPVGGAGPTMPSAYAPGSSGPIAANTPPYGVTGPAAQSQPVPYSAPAPYGQPPPPAYGQSQPIYGQPSQPPPYGQTQPPYGQPPHSGAAPPYAQPTWGTGQGPPPGMPHAPPAASGGKWVVPVVIGAVAITGIIALAAVLGKGRGRGAMTPAPDGACGAVAACVNTNVSDPKHVDPYDYLPSAKKLAQGVDSRASLTAIFAMECVKEGTVDIASGYGNVMYQFGTPDGSLTVLMRQQYTSVMRGPGAGTTVPEPKCGVKDAYKTMVNNGAATDKPMSIYYQADPTTGQPVWFGLAQKRYFYIDPNTCALKKALP